MVHSHMYLAIGRLSEMQESIVKLDGTLPYLINSIGIFKKTKHSSIVKSIEFDYQKPNFINKKRKEEKETLNYGTFGITT